MLEMPPVTLKEPSDFKEAMGPVDVWRSAMTMSGAQCVMTHLAMKRPLLLAGNWVLRHQVR